MVASELERQLAETTATIPSLREALAETNRGMVALTWLLDKRLAKPWPKGAGSEYGAVLLDVVRDSVVDAVFTLDDEGVIESANQAAEAVLGRSRDEMVGRPLTDFLSGSSQGELQQAILRIAAEGDAGG